LQNTFLAVFRDYLGWNNRYCHGDWKVSPAVTPARSRVSICEIPNCGVESPVVTVEFLVEVELVRKNSPDLQNTFLAVFRDYLGWNNRYCHGDWKVSPATSCSFESLHL
jgi:hypothetical protein